MAKDKDLKDSDKQYERLARVLQTIIEGGYISHRRLYRINFVRGIFFGLGTALGGTAVLALVIWMLTFFQELPFVGDFVQVIEDSLNN